MYLSVVKKPTRPRCSLVFGVRPGDVQSIFCGVTLGPPGHGFSLDALWWTSFCPPTVLGCSKHFLWGDIGRGVDSRYSQHPMDFLLPSGFMHWHDLIGSVVGEAVSEFGLVFYPHGILSTFSLGHALYLVSCWIRLLFAGLRFQIRHRTKVGIHRGIKSFLRCEMDFVHPE